MFNWSGNSDESRATVGVGGSESLVVRDRLWGGGRTVKIGNDPKRLSGPRTHTKIHTHERTWVCGNEEIYLGVSVYFSHCPTVAIKF